jgi:eukaryotic-like serine/threonine-protein kinase
MTMRTSTELAEGFELSGSIRLEKKLGEGGMGSVWTAQHLALRTQVAVKFLAAHMAQDAAAAARFQREAMAAARIKSPHVVQIFDHGLSPQLGPYIVMELLEGETLSSFVQRHGRLTPPVTARILTQLCRALSKAHAQGIVHRDVKPDNLFLIDAERDVFVKVLDFGIAKNLRDELSVTSTGSLMGTPHYMSPEQMLSSKHVDLRADLWASAVVAYHCLTGGVPFDGETFGAVAVAVTQAQFSPPFAQYGVGSEALDAWFSRALSRELSARFSSAEELSDSFTQLANSWRGSASAWGAGHALEAPATTLATGSELAAPTFNGVASTNGAGRPKPRARAPLLLALGSAAVLLAFALAFWKLREPPSTPISASASGAVPATALPKAEPPPALLSPVTPPPAASRAEPAPTPSASPPAPSTKAPPPRRVKPSAPPSNTSPSRPDRGF